MARRRRFYAKPNPLGGTLTTVLIFAGVGLGAYLLFKPKITAALSAANATTLTPGEQTIKTTVGSLVTVALPAGASWTVPLTLVPSPSGITAPSSGSAPATFTFTGNTQGLATWTDSSGQQQMTTLTVST